MALNNSSSPRTEWAKLFIPIVISVLLSAGAGFWTAELRNAQTSWDLAQLKADIDRREKENAAWKLREETSIQGISGVVSTVNAQVTILLKKNGL